MVFVELDQVTFCWIFIGWVGQFAILIFFTICHWKKYF